MGSFILIMSFMLVSLVSNLLLFHIVVTCSFSTNNSVQPSCHDDERSALWQFKQSFVIQRSASVSYGANPKVLQWELEGHNTNCCLWDGITCDSDTGHVIVLNLSSSCLFGSLNSNSTLFRLIHLQELNLADNHFNYSQIPTSVGQFSEMRVLNLSHSFFSGQIPYEISHLSKLSFLVLSFNYDERTGEKFLELRNPSLSNLLQNLTRLQLLDLGFVDISSAVPDFLANFSSLFGIHLTNCGLHGEFPIKIFQLPNLQALDLQTNPNLTGYLPEFFERSPLRSLRLYNTSFSGKIPSSIEKLDSLIELCVNSCNFSGPIPSSLGKLSQLSWLDLGGNHFSGHIPSSLQNLNQLTIFYLGGNQLIDRIPSWLGNLTQLTQISLHYNHLCGCIPFSLGRLSQLSLLDLGDNNFSGYIPYSLHNLTQLIVLSFTGNQLSDPIPSWLGNLTQLTGIHLQDNHLCGSIPQSLSKLMNLEDLYLNNNNLTGNVDFRMFFDMKRLAHLNLGNNNLSLLFGQGNTNATVSKFKCVALCGCNLSEFPYFLRYQRKLERLELSGNQIRGQIPKWIRNTGRETLLMMDLSSNFLTGFQQPPANRILPWASLRVMGLSFNMLQGPLLIPPPSTLHYDVSNNRLSGEISSLICNLNYLSILDLSNNSFSGLIPQCLGNFSNSLMVLNLKNNSFSGNIPLAFNRARNLRMLDLSHNEFEGQLPRSLAACVMLESLDLKKNHFLDVFPTWLGSLPALKHLILGQNRFYGEIGKPETSFEFLALRVIDLSFNNFSGELPSEFISNWSAMKADLNVNSTYLMVNEIIDMEGKYYRLLRNYPYSFTIVNKHVETIYAKIQAAFASIDLSSNKFGGGIPEMIGDLKGLKSLNLSNNRLTGCIPPSLGMLSQLESLDLSQNKLSREIPQQLVQLTSLGSFNVSHNNLSGKIPQGNQLSTFDSTAFEGNPGLCGIPLFTKCDQTTVEEEDDDDDDDDSNSLIELDWKFCLSGFISGLVVGVALGDMMITTRQGRLLNNFHWRRETRGRRS